MLSLSISTLDAIRTHDLLLRRQLLYPAELPGLNILFSISCLSWISQHVANIFQKLSLLTAAELPGHILFNFQLQAPVGISLFNLLRFAVANSLNYPTSPINRLPPRHRLVGYALAFAFQLSYQGLIQ